MFIYTSLLSLRPHLTHSHIHTLRSRHKRKYIVLYHAHIHTLYTVIYPSQFRVSQSSLFSKSLYVILSHNSSYHISLVIPPAPITSPQHLHITSPNPHYSPIIFHFHISSALFAPKSYFPQTKQPPSYVFSPHLSPFAHARLPVTPSWLL